jgi:hypothetical protein
MPKHRKAFQRESAANVPGQIAAPILPAARTVIAAVAALAFGLLAVLQALSGQPRTGSVLPETFTDARIAPRMMLAAIEEQKRKIPAAAVRETSQAALARSPLSPVALGLLGKHGFVEGQSAAKRDAADASRAMVTASALTRRNAMVEAWLAEAALQSGNVNDGLGRFDHILRVYPELGDEILQRMAMVLGSAEARQSLRSLLARDPPWRDRFLIAIAAKASNLEGLSAFVREVPRLPDNEATRTMSSTLVSRLVDADKGRVLLQTYPRLPGVDPKAALGTLDTTRGFAPVAWQTASSANAGSFVEASEEDGLTRLQAWVNPGHSAAPLRKLIAVRPGAYRLAWTATRRTEVEQGDVRWRVYCGTRAGGVPLVESGNILGGQGVQQVDFAATAECPVYFLVMMVSGGDAASMVEVELANLSLRPISAVQSQIAKTPPGDDESEAR